MRHTMPTGCEICGLSNFHSRLVRITWRDTKDELVMEVPAVANENDAFLCEECIRDIKRLPFSAIAASPPVPDHVEIVDFDPPIAGAEDIHF